MNMQTWLRDQMTARKRQALPLLSAPAVQLMGIRVGGLLSDSNMQAQGMYQIARRCPAAAAVAPMDLSVEAECFGAPIRFSPECVPMVTAPIISTPGDAGALPVPTFGAGRTDLYVESVSKACRLIPDRPVFGGMIGPFSLAGNLIGLRQAMVSCCETPEMIRVVLEKAALFLISYAKAYKTAGAQGIILAEPAAGLLPPGLCGVFSSRYVKQIVDAVQDESFLVIYHNCGGGVIDMVPEILDTGAGAYHFGNAVSMEGMLRQMPEDILSMGNVDPVSVIGGGTPKAVREATLALLETCGRHPNFLISSGCDIPATAPWENIDAFFAAVEEFYGK